jgi:hypothetical protein
MHACIYIHARPATRTNGSPMRARRAHVRTCARVRARVRVCDRAPTHPPRHVRVRSVGVDRRWLRLAGVLLGVGVQRGHRRVEHRRGHHAVSGMRRFSGPAVRHCRRDALGRDVDVARAVVRGGAADACARVCAQTCGNAHARVPPCVGISARSRDRLYACVFMYVCI